MFCLVVIIVDKTCLIFLFVYGGVHCLLRSVWCTMCCNCSFVIFKKGVSIFSWTNTEWDIYLAALSCVVLCVIGSNEADLEVWLNFNCTNICTCNAHTNYTKAEQSCRCQSCLFFFLWEVIWIFSTFIFTINSLVELNNYNNYLLTLYNTTNTTEFISI